MIRSIPPASAHLALRPVPGPAADDRPALGDLAAEPVENLVARSCGTWSLHRGSGWAAHQVQEVARGGVGEGRVVDVLVAVDRAGRTGGPSRPVVEGVEQGARRPRGRGTGRPGASSAETPPSGSMTTRRRRRTGRGPRPIRAPERGVLLGGGPHQGDRRVVGVEESAGEPLGDGRPRPKLTMSSAPTLTTCGIPAPDGRLQPVGPGREDAADQLVGQLGRRQVEHAGDLAVADQPLHRLAADPGRVEDDHLAARALRAPAGRGRRTGSSRRTSSPRPAGGRRRRLGDGLGGAGPSPPSRARRWSGRSGSAGSGRRCRRRGGASGCRCRRRTAGSGRSPAC